MAFQHRKQDSSKQAVASSRLGPSLGSSLGWGRMRKRDLPGRQRGMGIWGYIGILLGVSIVVTLGLRLGPHYMNQRTLVTIVESIGTQPIHQMEIRKIKDLLKKRFKINSLYDLEPKDVLSIERTKAHTEIAIDYEVRESMFANVDVVLVFNDQFQFR